MRHQSPIRASPNSISRLWENHFHGCLKSSELVMMVPHGFRRRQPVGIGLSAGRNTVHPADRIASVFSTHAEAKCCVGQFVG